MSKAENIHINLHPQTLDHLLPHVEASVETAPAGVIRVELECLRNDILARLQHVVRGT